MIYIIQLEPMEERYTFWWENYIPNKIKKNNIDCYPIKGDILTAEVKTGTVLDAGGTNYYKSSQIKEISKLFYENKIKAHDSFLVTDIWFPGIEAIRYMSHLYNIPVNIWGIWHAGSSTMNDFAEPMHKWSKYFEVGFLNMCNGVFVGSEYSKKSIIERLLYFVNEEETNSIEERIHAFGMPLDYEYLQQFNNDKEKIILFPHRPDIEKNPNIFINIIQALSLFWEEFDNYKFIFCTSKKEYTSKDTWINAILSYAKMQYKNIEIKENLSKTEYYNLLNKSSLMISTTSEENFGYCAVEAMALGTQVLLPNAFSHPEIVEENSKCLYNTYDDLLSKIPIILKNPVNTNLLKEYVKPYSNTVEQWLKIMNYI